MASVFAFEITGSHTGAINQATVLTDSTKNFTTLRVQTGDYVYNITDGSVGTITSVGTTTLTCSGGLSGGAENDWDTGDLYRIWVTDTRLIRFTLTDVLYFPMFLEATVSNRQNTAEPSFSDYQKVRLVDSDVTGHYLFYGKITKIKPQYDDVYGQTIILEAKDNLNELLNSIVNTNYSADTYRGKADAPTGLINQIVVDHTRSGNITATGDTIRFETSETSAAAGVLDTEFVNKGKNALRAVVDIAVEDPWDATRSGFGYDYFLDTSYGASMAHAPVMHYFKRGTRPVGDPNTYGLIVEYEATQSARTRTMLPDYNFPKATNELVTKVRLEYAETSSGSPPTTTAQSITAILIEIENIAGGAFAADNVITWNGGGDSATVEFSGTEVGEEFLCISGWTGTINDADSIVSGAVTADVKRVLRETIEQDVEVLVRDYTITDKTEARARVAQILHQAGNTIERGEFSVVRWPHYWITATHTAIASGTVLTSAGASFINNGIVPGDWVTNTGVADSKNITGVITSRTATTITCSAGGMNWETGDTYIVYLHVRAGHNIRVKNSNKSLDQNMVVTRIEYDEGPGIAFARLETKNITTGQRATVRAFESLGRGQEDNVVNVMRSSSSTTRVEFSSEGIFGYNAGAAQFYLISSDGKAYFAGGKAVIDEDGITLDSEGAATGLFITFIKGATTVGWLYADPTNGDLFLSTGTGRIGLGQQVTPTFLADEGIHFITSTGKNLRLTAPSNNGATGYVVLDSQKTNAGNPGTPREGMIYINTTDNEIRMYADGAWRTLAGPW